MTPKTVGEFFWYDSNIYVGGMFATVPFFGYDPKKYIGAVMCPF